MKKVFLYILPIIYLGISCRKNLQIKLDSPKSKWTLDSIVFKGYTKTFPYVGEVTGAQNLNAYGSLSGNYVTIKFQYLFMPTKSGIYKVKNYAQDNTECTITSGVVGDIFQIYTSINSNLDVNITISPSGKFSASFSNIVLMKYNSTETKIISGTLLEQ